MTVISSDKIDFIKKFVIERIKDIIGAPDDTAAFIAAVRKGLLDIINECTTKEYTFNLAMEHFVGRAPSNCYDALKTIVEKDIDAADDFNDEEDDLNVAFAAYYALSLIYKKQNLIADLADLVTDKYDAFDVYPLRFEIKSRYYKRIGEYETALENDEHAINILESRGVVNQAVGVSYASTVCTILEKSRAELSEERIYNARKYIEDAIAVNPGYPKYYFLKAKLRFYSTPLNADDEVIKQVLQEVNESIKTAEVSLYGTHYGKGKFKATEEKAYSEFKKRVKDTLERRKTPMFPKKDEELDALKKIILSCANQDVCSAGAKLPPVPELKKGDKYFFICYSSKDFKSVYCDLIELYKRKVPFRYDERLTRGVDWAEQVEKYISDQDCVGVVFYLSENILSTGSVVEEMDIVNKHQKKHFSVNIEGGLAPSKILIKIILNECTSRDPEECTLKGDAMRKYLNFFNDRDPFAHKLNSGHPQSDSHFDSYIDFIQESFPSIIISE